MYGQRLCGHVSLISHPYGDSSAPPLFRHRDPYDPLLSADRRTRTRTNLILQLQYPPGDTDTDQLISQISQVLLRREAPRDRSYQGPSTTLCLLRRTLPTKALGTQRTGSYQGFVRFASITQINPR